jgi:hypothetical protein
LDRPRCARHGRQHRHRRPRSAEARTSLTGANGGALDGTCVSIAIADTGADPHPAFQAKGATGVVRNLKNVCTSGTPMWSLSG